MEQKCDTKLNDDVPGGLYECFIFNIMGNCNL